ncbi:MAG: hypothetical protein IPN55_06000 [Saprospiraceae bacterium]|nr:hypothetical protein [Candidatus Brachybacter algidus]
MDKVTLRITRAKQLGFAFFIILAIANLSVNLIDGKFRMIDVIFVAITILPYALNKNWITLSFGVINAFISTFFFIAIFTSNPHAVFENNVYPLLTFAIGAMFGIISLIASGFLIYVGLYDQDQMECIKVRSAIIG